MENEILGSNSTDQMSKELLILIEYIRKKITKELPTLMLTPAYLILAILEKRDCLGHQVLIDTLSSQTLSQIYKGFYDSINSKTLNALRPNIIPKFNSAAEKIFENAFSVELPKFPGVSKLNSLHILLALLNEDTGDEDVKRVFAAAKLTYATLVEKAESTIKEIANGEDISLPEPIIEDISEDENNGTTSIIIAPNNGNLDMTSFIQKVIEQRQQHKKNSVLESICNNLNELAAKDKIDPIIGREKELSTLINILGRKKKNNAVVVGADGVGKTALCEGLAYKIVKGEVPTFLAEKTIWSLNLASLMSGTQYRGILEGKLQEMMTELKTNGKNILYIDDISVAFADKKNSDVDISTILNSMLNDGDVQIIGSCGFKGYRTSFDSNPSLARKFQKIVLEETSEADTVNILNNIKEKYENYHGVKYDSSAINACVRLAKKYSPERHLPDSAIDILDECGSRESIISGENEDISRQRKEIIKIEEHIAELKRQDGYDKIDEEKEKLSKAKMDLSRTIQQQKANHIAPTITEETVCNYVSEKTGIPINRLSVNDKKNILSINDLLKANIIGQDEAIDKVCRAIKRNRVGLGSKKTMGAFLMCGKTGVGKTLLAKQLAKLIFGDEKYLVRIDMSEYEDKTSVNKLIGSSAGYIGYDNGGILTETIKNKKYCVLLLDEFEKADNEVYNLFLQVFDEGFLSDNTGQKIDFRNIIVIMTSNVGAKNASEFGKGIGFGDEDKSTKILEKELKKKFSPEFLNRLDDIVFFNALNDDNLKKIIRLELNKLQERIKEIGHSLTFDENIIDYIFEHIDEKDYGARPILRILQNEIENPITDLILENEYKEHIFNITYFSGDSKLTIA